MHTHPATRTTPAVLVVGSFPPVAGPASEASLAAVRRSWADGDDVVTASLRPGAADLVARVAGPAAGWCLRRAQAAAGRPSKLVLGLTRTQFGLVTDPGRRRAWHRLVDPAAVAASVFGLTRALDRFDHVTVLLSGPLGLPAPLRRSLWRHVDVVVVDVPGGAMAQGEGVPAAKVQTVEAYRASHPTSGVTLLGPREVLPRDVPLVLVGVLGRRLLGEHFLQIRSQAIRVARRAKRQLVATRG